MADLVALPGVFEQIRLVAGVRWRILKNGLRRKHNRWDLIAMLWVAVCSASLVIGVCFAFYAGGYEFIQTHRIAWFPLLYWILFAWWQVLPVFIAGFGSNFEFSTLLRFPLSLRAFYLLGLGYGFSDFAAISSICWILSIVAGVATARPNLVPVVLGISLLFILLNVTLERLVASWVEKLLAKRRTREIFIGVIIILGVSTNFLNPALHKGGYAHWGSSISHFIPYFWWAPGSLAGNAIYAASLLNLRGVLSGLLGLFTWVLLLSALLWHRFAAQYSGEEISDTPPAALRKKQKKLAVSEELPGVLSPQVVAVIAKEFRYLTRNGMAFISLIIPPVMVLFFSMQFGPGSPLKEHAVKPVMFFPAIMGYLLLILVTPAYNSFAYEGKGIQTYFMAPIRFRDVLLGKNLFLLALIALELSLAFAMLTYRVGWPGAPMFIATIAGGAFAIVGQLAIANWSSLSFPKKMDIGKMKGQRNSGVAVWTAFGMQITVGGICALILFAGRWTGNPWVPPIAFSALTAAAVGGYVSSLDALDRLAEAKKELLIEALSK
jgi:ABC-2 type transport system permease protein